MCGRRRYEGTGTALVGVAGFSPSEVVWMSGDGWGPPMMEEAIEST